MSLLLARVGGGVSNVLTGTRGTYSLTGQAATFKSVHNLTAVTGSYSLTGIAASFKVAHTLSATVGSYTYTGVAATFKNTRSLLANTGSYSLTGIAATFNYVAGAGSIAYSLSGATGSYSLSGQVATFKSVHTLLTTNGSYAISGQNALFKQTHTLLANNGSYALNGVDAVLTYVSNGTVNYRLTGNAGSYLIAANDASFNFSGASIGAPSYESYVVKKGNKLFVFKRKQDALNALNDDGENKPINAPKAKSKAKTQKQKVIASQAQETYDLNAVLEALQAKAQAQYFANQQKYEALIRLYEEYLDEQDVELLLLFG